MQWTRKVPGRSVCVGCARAGDRLHREPIGLECNGAVAIMHRGIALARGDASSRPEP